MGAVSVRYEAVYGKQLVLHGYKLGRRLSDGNLPGLRSKNQDQEKEGTMELTDGAAALGSPDSNRPVVEITDGTKADGIAADGTAADGAAARRSAPFSNRLVDELRWLVVKKGPLLLKDVASSHSSFFASSYSSLFHKSYGGRTLEASLREGRLEGLRYDATSGKVKLDDPQLSPAAPRNPEALPAPPAVHANVSVGEARAAVAPPAEMIAADPAPATVTERRAMEPAVQRDAGASTTAGQQRPGASFGRSVPPTPAPTSVAERRAMKPALQRDAGASTTAGQQRPGATFGRPVPPTQQPALTGGRVSDAVGVPSSTTAAPSVSPPSSGTKLRHLLVDSPASCNTALATLSGIAWSLGRTLQHVCVGSMAVVHLNGRQLGSEAGFISLIKVQIIGPLTSQDVIIFDVVALDRTRAGQTLLHEQLRPLLADQKTTKVVHDFNNSAIALRRYFGAGFAIRQVLDLQLAFEAVHGGIGAAAVSVMGAFGPDASYSDAACRAFSFDEAATARRPLDTSTLGAAAMAIQSLAKVTESAVSTLSDTRQKDIVLHASQLGTDFAITFMLQDTRRVAFRNHGSCWGGGIGRVLTSFELKQAREISAREMMIEPSAPGLAELLQSSQPAAAAVDGGNRTSLFGNMKSFLGNMKLGEAAAAEENPNSPCDILRLAPEQFLVDHLTERHAQNLKDLVELIIDEGRRPYATLQGRGKLYLCNDETVVVTKAHIDKVAGRLDTEGRFGHDNRAGVPGQLHRLSVMRSREGGRIFGVTLRISRYFPGSASIIDDLLFHVQGGPDKPERAASILILGKPGSGKTTVLRDICRKVSEEQTVVIVDTSNEIAGDGDIPHLQAIGQSRRMMVPNKDGQHSVMIEALQNHTPQTIVVDEVSNKLEARACLDIKARGVRVVASAHGDLESLLKNPELNSLVGGKTSVTLGDTLARATNGGNKVQAQRAGAPIFDVIVEVERGEVSTWSIVRNVDLAVDAILDGKPYQVEKRTCISRETSDLHQEASDPEDATFLLKCINEVEKTRQYY